MVIAQILSGGRGYVLPLRSGYDRELMAQTLQSFLKRNDTALVRIGAKVFLVRRVGPGVRCSSCDQPAYGVLWPEGLCTRCLCEKLPRVSHALVRAA